MDTITPDQMTTSQDQLIAAGSKISYRDLYDMEIKIPIHKKHYYKAEDVDNLFVIINGVFMDISAQTHRDQKALSLARQELQKIQGELSEKDSLLERIQSQNNQLEEHLSELILQVTEQDAESATIEDMEKQIWKLESRDRYLTAEQKKAEATIESLKAQLDEKTEDYERLLDSSAKRFEEFESTIDEMSQGEPVKEVDESLIKSKDLIIGNLENEVDVLQTQMKDKDETITELTDKLELLEYRFKQLETLSQKRISQLSR